MKRRLGLLFFILLVMGVAWVAFIALRTPSSQTEADSGDNPSAESALANSDGVPSNSMQPGVFDPASGSDVAGGPALNPAVLPVPKPLALAAMEEPPAGPEASEAHPNILPPATALENMRAALRQYQLRFHENPVGDNAEITHALNGGNSRQVVFLQPDDGMRLNERGELVDSWGTPYFFHQLSRTEMEIRSAGPDRRAWTADDLVMK